MTGVSKLTETAEMPRLGAKSNRPGALQPAPEPFMSAAEAEEVVSEALHDRRLSGREIDLEGVDLSELVGRLLATTREFERRMRTAEREAVIDPLTGLGNRRQWRSALRKAEERCRRGNGDAVIAMVDLDDFKLVNDVQGHAAGDRLLMRLAQTLAGVVRAGDTVARTGGDEFAVLAFSTDQAQTLAERLSRALDDAGIDASVGTASRRGAGTLDRAWEQADEEMYAVKARGKQRGDGAEGQAAEPVS
jgi:diguanylate cyclase (GGDEF)-like protein